ncbi:MAG: glycosyltransferase family 39 protein [Verrucomicrobia bacterium]|nr:glycosyltransferase family 39 protein [Verrucomicrobiota bacterium]
MLLLLLAGLFFAAGTWSLPLIDRDEPRFAEASREMRARGDYVVPYFNNGYRFDKPPLTYWAQVVCYNCFGENDFAARFPSVLAAAATVGVVYGFGTRLYGAGVGWGAALIFLTSLQVSMHAKGAVADMLMVLFFTLSTWAGWELLRGGLPSRARWGWWGLFYGSLALGFLAKGPVAWLPLFAVGIFAAQRKTPPTEGGRTRAVLGCVLLLALVSLWGIPALERTHGEFLKVGIGKHVIGRSVSTMEGHGGGGMLGYVAMLPLYFVTLFLSFFPWSIRLPWLLGRLRRAEGGLRDEQRFLLLGIALVFGIFSLVRTKLPHYTLPAFPLLALLLARELLPERRESLVRWAKGTLVVGAAIFLLGFPLLARFFPGYVLLQKSAAALRPEMEFASTGYQEPSLVWYARRSVHGWYSPLSARKLAEFMAKPGPRFCVVPEGTLTPAPGWQVFETRGFNLVHFKSVALQLMVKPE